MRRTAKTRRTASGSYDRSRYNALRYGVMIHDVLPSRGESCVKRDRCDYMEDPNMRKLCRAGHPCPSEEEFLGIWDSMTYDEYAHRCTWLDKETLRRVIHDLGLLFLRFDRLSAQMADEGFVREIRGPNGERWRACTVASTRYMASLDRQQDELWTLLNIDPENR